MEKLNLVEILKDCPKGTRLYSPVCGECTLEGVDEKDPMFPISVNTTIGFGVAWLFTAEGKYYDRADTECILFPSKDQRDWSKFQRPFLDGDIIYVRAAYEWVAIYKESSIDDIGKYVGIRVSGDVLVNGCESLCYKGDIREIRYATEEEKAKLFQAIKDKGYKWNAETKTLEKLFEPKFKVGDKVIYHEIESEIDSMEWDGVDVVYTVNRNDELWDTIAFNLQPYKEETMKDYKVTGSRIDFSLTNKIELELGDTHEVVVEDGKTYVVRKKPQYPTTYEECCRIVNANPCVRIVYDLSNGQKYSYDIDNLQHYENIRKLLICRDAYWKIAGDWKFNFDNSCYYLCNEYGSVQKFEGTIDCSAILSFPTKEMRDAFFENFKELIDACKELL